MAIADRNRIKRYLGIRATVVVHDGLIDELRLSALAMIETFLAKLSREMATASTASTWPAIRSFRRENDVASATVTVITLASLATQPDYATRIEPILSQSVVDAVAHLYRHRSPNASSETQGGGVSDSWDDVGPSGLPKRVEGRLRDLIETIEA
jgi:hypothetical protein